MPLNGAVSQVLRELRQEKGISQEKLADAIGSHQVYISEIENGKKLPSLEHLYKAAQYYKLSLSQITALIEAKIK